MRGYNTYGSRLLRVLRRSARRREMYCNGRQRGAVWGYVCHIDESTVVARLESFVTEPEVAAQLRLNRLGRPVMQGHLYFNSNPLSRPQADDGILALGRPRPASAIQ